jgi:hypothetical protein
MIIHYGGGSGIFPTFAACNRPVYAYESSPYSDETTCEHCLRALYTDRPELLALYMNALRKDPVETKINAPYHFVYNPKSGLPSREHLTYESARTEAERLARLNPGQQFFVLSPISVSTLPSITTQLLVKGA